MTFRDLLKPSRHSVPVKMGGHPIRAFQEEINSLFEDYFGEFNLPVWTGLSDRTGLQPRIDLSETDAAFVISAEVPGLGIEGLSLSVHEGYLTLKGEKKEDIKDEKQGYLRQERRFGSFQRVIHLPEIADIDAADAQIKDGVLTISVPKKPAAKAEEKTISIREIA